LLSATDNVFVGGYPVEALVESTLIVELKAAKALDSAHLARCLNYLKATRHPVCLLRNFGRPRLEICRFVRGR